MFPDLSLCLMTSPLDKSPSQGFQDLRNLVHQALADRVLTRAEQQQIMAAILDDNYVSWEEQQLLEDIAEQIRQGQIQVVD